MAESLFLAYRISCVFSRLPLYLILSNKGWGWCPVNTVCAVCANFLNNSVLSVAAVCVCEVLAETKSGA